MIENFRKFEAGPDPYGATWRVEFLWLQNGISIRHADTIDCKFVVDDGSGRQERVIALPHAVLRSLHSRLGMPLSDTWCSRLAAAHLKRMIETGEDIEKTLVTITAADIEEANAALGAPAAARD
jgi:hypothetical protein